MFSFLWLKEFYTFEPIFVASSLTTEVAAVFKWGLAASNALFTWGTAVLSNGLANPDIRVRRVQRNHEPTKIL